MGKATRRVLGISPRETSFARRGFRCDSPAVRAHLEEVGACFVRGYNAALESRRPDELAARIAAQVLPPFSGFAYEGAAMALTLLDVLTPWRRDRLQRLLAGPGDAHLYIVHVGAGWALARLPVPVDWLLARLDPNLRWLTLDGYGFHDGFFHWPRTITRQEVPRRLRGYARRAYDLGVGRSLWFVEGAGAGRIAARIAAFPAARRRELWSGVGLACAYAGGADAGALADLCQAAAADRPALAQGVAFAATARARAGNPTPDTELACRTICSMTSDKAAALAERTRPAAAHPSFAADLPPFEVWRQRIQQLFHPGAAAP
jgi:hypothetical protein